MYCFTFKGTEVIQSLRDAFERIGFNSNSGLHSALENEKSLERQTCKCLIVSCCILFKKSVILFDVFLSYFSSIQLYYMKQSVSGACSVWEVCRLSCLGGCKKCLTALFLCLSPKVSHCHLRSQLSAACHLSWFHIVVVCAACLARLQKMHIINIIAVSRLLTVLIDIVSH